MPINMLRLMLLICALFFFSGQCAADAVTTEFSRDKIALGETVTVTYTANTDMRADIPDFSVLQNDFQILGTNYGNSVSILNGVTTRQTIWQLSLQPKKTGTLMLPAITFGNDKSSPRQLTVEAAADRDNKANSNQDAPVFVQAEINSTTPYIQSQVLYKLKIYYQTRLENPRIGMPQMKDATFMQLGAANQYQTTMNGKPFLVVENNFAFFPQKAGKITIPAARFSAYTYDDTTSLSNQFFVTQPKTVNLATKELTMDVQQAPAGFKGANWLPAKNIALTEDWSQDSNQWDAGNPVTRIITVTAQGLRADQIPDFTFPKMLGMNIYVDTPKRSNNVIDTMVIGTLVQKVTYIPNLSQSFSIPSLTLSWWNTTTNTNAVAELAMKSVLVTGKVSNPISPVTPQLSQTPLNITPVVKERELKPQAILFYKYLWFWIATFFFVLWLVTLSLVWRKKPAKINQVTFISEPELLPPNSTQELNEKTFQQACEQGNTTRAQQYLLSWARNEFQDNDALNLDKLSQLVEGEDFKNALKNLEQAIYAKQSAPWNGRSLLMAYKSRKKSREKYLGKFISSHELLPSSSDPLPPLYL